MKERIGVIASLHAGEGALVAVLNAGLNVCQLVSWDETDWTDETADQIKAASKKLGIHITAFWAGWPGPAAWNLVEGPITLGLVPAAYRARRVETLKRAGTFASRIGLPAVITHLGFIPENPLDTTFHDVVVAVRDVANHLQRLGLQFWFETGQETPITMLRLIQAVGTSNLGINLDPANLIMYGKANPIDALEILGRYVRNVHVKDGMYPTDPMKLGNEVKVGQGRVRFREFVRRLGEIGFTGEFIIERETSGEEQLRDIRETAEYLKILLGKEEK